MQEKVKPLRSYLAGPMTGYPDFNFPAFFDAEEKLKNMGYIVYNPASEDMKMNPDLQASDVTPDFCKDVIRHDIHLILHRVDQLVFLPGWEKSKGAKLEFSLARFLGLQCYELSEDDDFVGLSIIEGDLEFKNTRQPWHLGDGF